MVQIWEHLFKTLQLHGKVLFEVGVIKTSDLEDYVHSTKSEKSTMVELGLPAYTLLKNLMISAKSDSPGLVLYNGQELTSSNRPQDRLMDWFFDPLVVLKEQIRAACLQPTDEHYLEKLVLASGHPEQLDFWQNGSIEPENNVKKGELQAIARRIQGITTTASRFPTFRRRFQQCVKSLIASGQKQGIDQANEGISKTERKKGEMSEVSIDIQSGDNAV
ncbi:hypothetical protein O6H91_Y101900 [Diphasiastrum complanatum]|nr:hypothetical protein O6H91_Y101900 [Diphasiastrum complanatum]